MVYERGTYLKIKTKFLRACFFYLNFLNINGLNVCPSIEYIKRNFSVIFISLSLIIYPATLLIIPKVNGLIFGLFALTGLVYLFIHRQKSMQTSRDEALFYIALVLFFFVALFITLNGGFVYKVIGKYLHLLLAIPVYIYLRHSGVKQAFIWYGLIFGAVAAAYVAFHDVFIMNWVLIRGFYHHIVFGDLALVLGCMSMAGLGWFKQRAAWQTLLPVLAFMCGIFSSVLSMARGGWLALPFVIIVFVWYIKSHFSLRKKFIMAVILFVFLSAMYFVPQTTVKSHVDRTIASLSQYGGSDMKSIHRRTSVGTRLEMWQASWKMFLDNPIMGVGWGHYQEHAKSQVKQGLRNQSAATFDHPHSEYFFALASGGVVGFTVLIFLFLAPASLFIKYIRHSKSIDSQRLALAGLILIVAYMAFGISEPLLYRSRSVNFFAFYLAVFMAGIYHENKKCIL